jgi:hypothetical protein
MAASESPLGPWDAWHLKFGVSKDDSYVAVLKEFLENGWPVGHAHEVADASVRLRFSKINEGTLRVDAESFERKKLHYLCDMLGLLHQSKFTRSRLNKFLLISKPDSWQLQATPSPELELTAKEYLRARAVSRQRFCDYCGVVGPGVPLLRSVHSAAVVCDDCLDNDENCGEDGEPLNCHKFEEF